MLNQYVLGQLDDMWCVGLLHITKIDRERTSGIAIEILNYSLFKYSTEVLVESSSSTEHVLLVEGCSSAKRVLVESSSSTEHVPPVEGCSSATSVPATAVHIS